MRARQPFATGHDGRVPVYRAQGVSDGRELVWKLDAKAGRSGSGECELNERLRLSGVHGPGCASSCEQGILLDAVLLSHGDRAIAPNLNKSLHLWAAHGPVTFRSRMREAIESLLVQTEKIMLAGIIDTDRHYMNVLVPGEDGRVALIDFATYDHEGQVFGSWEGIPCAHKVIMFGVISLGMGFCAGGPLPSGTCEVAHDIVADLVADDLRRLQRSFTRHETPSLIDDALRIFLEQPFSMEAKLKLQFGVGLGDTLVPYMKGAASLPSDELVLQTAGDGAVIVSAVHNITKTLVQSTAAEFGIGVGWRLLHIISCDIGGSFVKRLSASAPLSDLDDVVRKHSLLFVFESPMTEVEYEQGMESVGLLPSKEINMARDLRASVQSVVECTGSGRPSRASLSGVKPGWHLTRITFRPGQPPGQADENDHIAQPQHSDSDRQLQHERNSSEQLLPTGTDLHTLDGFVSRGILTLTFHAPWAGTHSSRALLV